MVLLVPPEEDFIYSQSFWGDSPQTGREWKINQFAESFNHILCQVFPDQLCLLLCLVYDEW